MRIVVLGASGGCGKEITLQALARGHEVVAVGRPSSALPDGVEQARGDLTDAAFLRGCFRGADAILLAVGFRLPGLAPWHRPEDPTFLQRCAAATVEAARAEQVGRVMAISAGGVAESWDAMPGAFRAFIRCTALRHAYAALAELEGTLAQSALDVCLVRPSGLTDEPASGAVRVVGAYAGRATIPRADVAGFMLDELAHRPFRHRAPLITVTGGV